MPSCNAETGGGVKIVSVMTTDSSGGAEFAAIEMLDALRQRGHETVMLSDMPAMARDTEVRVAPVSLGPKLSTTSWVSLALRWPSLLMRLRGALMKEAPYDVLMVHYKKEQLLAGMLPAALRSTVVWAEWGPVPFPLRRGIPRRAYLRAGDRAALVMAISEGTRRSVADVGVAEQRSSSSQTSCAPTRSATPRTVERGCARSSASPSTRSSSAASPASTPRSETTSWCAPRASSRMRAST